MSINSGHVLIVGAGPVGLALAIQLRRFGVKVRIVDSAARPSNETKAMAIHSRTLEVFRDLGVVGPFLEQGTKIERFVAHQRRKPILTYDFARLGALYPFLLSIPQPQTEAILLTRLLELGVQPERGVTLLETRQDAHAVRAELQLADGTRQITSYPWLIGCDGGRSTVRQQYGLSYEGASYDRHFMLADVDIAWNGSHEEGAFFLGEGEGYVGLAPIPGKNRFRFFVEVPHPLPPIEERAELALETFQKIASDRGHAMKLSNPTSMTMAEFRHRMVDRLRVGRVFLAGDSAHIGSPIGGQYMNLGINEAYNLGWKLGYVVQGLARESLLDSYDQERMPIARQAERTAHLLTKLFTTENRSALFARNHLLPLLSSLPKVADKLPRGLSGHAFVYRGAGAFAEQVSPKRVHRPAGVRRKLKVRAGDLAPDLLLSSGQRLIESLGGTRCVILLFAGRVRLEERLQLLSRMASGLVRTFSDAVRPIIVWPAKVAPSEAPDAEVLVDEDLRLHSRFGASSGAIFLIRPDGYVGYVGPDGLAEDLKRCLEQTLHFASVAPLPERRVRRERLSPQVEVGK